MMKKLLFFTAVSCLCAMQLKAETAEVDTVRVYEMGEVVVSADPKTVGDLSRQPLSYSRMSEKDIERLEFVL